MIDRARFFDLLMKVAVNRPADFVGLGVIAYSTTEGLPVFPLGRAVHAQADLPVHGEEQVMNALSSIATRNNPQHDGFHLINGENGDLTHLAQFVSPPLDKACAHLRENLPNGARQMTALLISLMHQVLFAAVVTADGNVQMYIKGEVAMSGGRK